MKTAAFLLALAIAAPTLGAQVPTERPDTTGNRAAHVVAPAPHAGQHDAEPGIYKGVPEDHHGCEEFASGDFITPHITDAHCLELARFPKIWETWEGHAPRWAGGKMRRLAVVESRGP